MALLRSSLEPGKALWVSVEDAETIKAIRAAFDAGITTVDTAEAYGEGHSERIVAEALSDVRDRGCAKCRASLTECEGR